MAIVRPNLQDYYKNVQNNNPYALNTDTQAIKNVYDQATAAAQAAEERAIINAENAWQRNLASTQATALDTIRKNNASAIATGASKGMQAANELSAILGLQDTATEEATALAQQRLDLADAYAAEYMKNAVTAQETANANKQAMMSAAMQQYGFDTEYAAQELLSRADIEASKWNNPSTAGLEYVARYETEIAELEKANNGLGDTDSDKAVKEANDRRIAELNDRIKNITGVLGASTTTPVQTSFKDSVDKAGYGTIKSKNYDLSGLKAVRNSDNVVVGEVTKVVEDNALKEALNAAGISNGKLIKYNNEYYTKGPNRYFKVSLNG